MPSTPFPMAMRTDCPVDLITERSRIPSPIGGPTTGSTRHRHTPVTPTLLAHFGIGYSEIFFFDHSPGRSRAKTVNCLTLLQLQGCEGSDNFPDDRCRKRPVTTPVSLGGMQQLGNALVHTATHTQRPSANSNLTWVRGNHTYKLGGEVWFQAQITAPPTGVGLTFAGLTNNGVANSSLGSVTTSGATGVPASLVTGSYSAGFPYANFLLGDITTATQYAPVDARMYKSQWALFLQDSWKITRKLTVDYGLRWDYATAPRDRRLHARPISA